MRVRRKKGLRGSDRSEEERDGMEKVNMKERNSKINPNYV